MPDLSLRLPAASPSTAFADVVVIIPALNEQESLPLVLNDLPDVCRVIVVDNGCTDHTSAVATDAGAHVVAESRSEVTDRRASGVLPSSVCCRKQRI